MTPIQKELYRSILSKCARILRWLRPDLLYPGKNVDILNELRNGAGNMKQHGSRNVKNMLMQLRKSAHLSYPQRNITHLNQVSPAPILV